jgi:hypothetical protein
MFSFLFTPSFFWEKTFREKLKNFQLHQKQTQIPQQHNVKNITQEIIFTSFLEMLHKFLL